MSSEARYHFEAHWKQPFELSRSTFCFWRNSKCFSVHDCEFRIYWMIPKNIRKILKIEQNPKYWTKFRKLNKIEKKQTRGQILRFFENRIWNPFGGNMKSGFNLLFPLIAQSSLIENVQKRRQKVEMIGKACPCEVFVSVWKIGRWSSSFIFLTCNHPIA